MIYIVFLSVYAHYSARAMTESSTAGQVTVDARGLSCPLPVLRLNKRIREVPPGGLLTLWATDRAALRDVPAYCAAHGHTVIETIEGKCLVFTIRRAAPP